MTQLLVTKVQLKLHGFDLVEQVPFTILLLYIAQIILCDNNFN
jgi:hypothetical protein